MSIYIYKRSIEAVVNGFIYFEKIFSKFYKYIVSKVAKKVSKFQIFNSSHIQMSAKKPIVHWHGGGGGGGAKRACAPHGSASHFGKIKTIKTLSFEYTNTAVNKVIS